MIDIKNISTHCTRSEFVGTAVLDTIGLVISGIDDTLLETMNVGMKYRCHCRQSPQRPNQIFSIYLYQAGRLYRI